MHAYNANQGSYDYYNNELEGELDAQAVRSKPESLDTLTELTKFNKRELKFLYRGFKQLCPLGTVKEDKFRLIYAQFFPKYAETNCYAKFVFNSFDVQRKQEITFTEFVTKLSILTRGSTDDKLRWIFSLYDLNNDGQITRDEFVRVANSIHDIVGKYNPVIANLQRNQVEPQVNASAKSLNEEPASKAKSHSVSLESQADQRKSDTDDLFAKFDLNQDGVITLDEFMGACRADSTIMQSISVFNTIL